MEKKVVLSTHNPHKAVELKKILPDYTILTLDDIGFTNEIEENGSSFEENALIKALAAHEACDYVCISDDSGLCVDALNGAPGIYSARYSSGSYYDNNIKLINELHGLSNEKRTASFVCCAAAVYPDSSTSIHTARVYGHITSALTGNDGFGYDPVFYVDEKQRTYAQMSEEEKNEISHRKKAFELLKEELDEYFEGKES